MPPYQRQTELMQSGRPCLGWVNQPVSRASSYVFSSVETLRSARAIRDTERVLSYAARGTDSTYALEDAFVALEGGYRAKLFPTGQAAIAVVFMTYLKAGDHVLITDAVYEPVRRFCRHQLARMGIEFDFYKADGSDLRERIRRNTRMVYVESPGSLVFEMVDLPAVAQWAHDCGCIVVADNTWGSGLLYNPLALGADVSIIAATKYAGGHADVMMGAVVSNESAWPALEMGTVDYGQTVGADDAWLVLRGLRTLPVRMHAHGQAAKHIAQWLEKQPAVEKIHVPFLPDHPSHALWQRDCAGTNGLLTLEFKRHITQAQADGFANALRLFGIAASWGGYESLVVPVDMVGARSVTDWSGRGPMLRLHVGLESPDDLIHDLAQSFTALQSL